MSQYPAGSGMMASINPPNSVEQLVVGGTPFEEVPVAEPIPWLPVSKNISWGLNDRVVTLTNSAINAQTSTPLGFDFPTIVYALSGAVRNTAGNAITGAFGNVLDTFTIQFVTSQGRQWQTGAVMGSSILGTGSLPRKLGRSCWRFNGGAVMRVLITPLVANLAIDVVLWTVETTIGSNIAPQPPSR